MYKDTIGPRCIFKEIRCIQSMHHTQKSIDVTSLDCTHLQSVMEVASCYDNVLQSQEVCGLLRLQRWNPV